MPLSFYTPRTSGNKFRGSSVSHSRDGSSDELTLIRHSISTTNIAHASSGSNFSPCSTSGMIRGQLLFLAHSLFYCFIAPLFVAFFAISFNTCWFQPWQFGIQLPYSSTKGTSFKNWQFLLNFTDLLTYIMYHHLNFFYQFYQPMRILKSKNIKGPGPGVWWDKDKLFSFPYNGDWIEIENPV